MRAVWDADGERKIETGTRNGIIYPKVSGAYQTGAVWNGLTSVTESPSGGEANKLYADDGTYITLYSNEEFGVNVEAYMYPDEFAECDGSVEVATGVNVGQQTRKPFGFSYVTTIANDEEGTDYGYKLHLCYGCKASPTEKQHQTIGESVEASQFSWEFTTDPVTIPGASKKSGHIEIDSTKVDATKLAQLEDLLYGTDASEGVEATDPTFPTPAQVVAIFS